MSVARFTPRQLYPPRKEQRCHLDRRLGGPQSRSGRYGEVKILDRILKREVILRPWGIRRTDHATPLYAQKLALTSLTSGGRSVGIVRSRTTATELVIFHNQKRLVLGK
jgi:hypothetical protein